MQLGRSLVQRVSLRSVAINGVSNSAGPKSMQFGSDSVNPMQKSFVPMREKREKAEARPQESGRYFTSSCQQLDLLKLEGTIMAQRRLSPSISARRIGLSAMQGEKRAGT